MKDPRMPVLLVTVANKQMVDPVICASWALRYRKRGVFNFAWRRQNRRTTLPKKQRGSSWRAFMENSSLIRGPAPLPC